MTNIKYKNNFLKISSIFLIGVFAVFLSFMPFLMNKKTDKVMADSVETESYSFSSSTTPIAVNLCSSNNPTNLTDNTKLVACSLNFTLNSSGFSLSSGSTRSFISSDNYGFDFYARNTTYTFSYDSWVNFALDFYDRFVLCSFIIPSGFNFNVIKFTVRNNDTNAFLGSYKGTEIVLTDSNNRLVYIQFPLTDTNYNSSISLLYRISKEYYLLDSSQLTDNQFYNQGYDDGYNAGESAGESAGYNNGYNAGYSSGENAGYNEGLVAGSDVSFLNLVGATIDAPVQAFNGLFDFNIDLGGSSFNLKNFLIALLTIALIIAFVRLIMAK